MIPIDAGAAHQARRSDPSALLVTVEYEQYGNNSPILLYWAHRRGWSFDKTSITPQVIELLRKDFGASYFVTTIWPVLQAARPDVVAVPANATAGPAAGRAARYGAVRPRPSVVGSR